MINLNQYDNRWKDVKLAPSSLTCGRYGCTTTSICMLSDYYKCFTIPSVAIDNNIKFTKEGLVLWNQINFPTFKWVRRYYKYDQAEVDENLRHPDKSLVLQVNNGAHWVAGVRKLPFGKYLVYDPLGGKRRIIDKKEIVGFSTFVRK